VRRARLLGSRDSAACSLGGKLIVQAIWYGSTRTPFTWDFFHELVTKAAYDGVLDCRVLLSRHDAAVVVTIFAGWPARRRRDHPWDEAAGFRPGDDVIGARRAEDRPAPPNPVWLPFLGVLLRRRGGSPRHRTAWLRRRLPDAARRSRAVLARTPSRRQRAAALLARGPGSRGCSETGGSCLQMRVVPPYIEEALRNIEEALRKLDGASYAERRRRRRGVADSGVASGLASGSSNRLAR
jgi:hypothetical protein